jgi:exodeoxyribonuclease V gamma subunit
MIHLHYSNRLEELIAPIAALVHEDQLRDPLEPVTIIVPGRAIEEFLKLRLGEREGVAANFHFPFLRGYLADIAQRAALGLSASALRVLDASGLQIAAFEYLRQALSSREADLEPLQRYLDAAEGDAGEHAVRLFQLSARVAWLFREYSTSRRSMLDRWHRGTTLIDPRLLEAERWQRRIYLSLFASDGALRPEWTSADAADSQTPRANWSLLPYAFAALDDGQLRAIVPPRLHIFGIGYAGPEFIRIFARLGAVTDLHLYTLNPCREFWEDVRDRKGARPPRIGPLFVDSAEDPFGLDAAASDNLALRYWGRAGREYIRLLSELTECDFDGHFVEPVAGERQPTLLHRVQQAILTRTPERLGGGSENIDCIAATPQENSSANENCAEIDEGSIRFLQCPGVRRELEIAADAIWSIVRRVPHERAGAPLRFHQIAIVIPESVRDQYLAQVESVFSDSHNIPVNIVDRRFAAESRVAEAVDLLLKLPLGRFTRGEMIRLLTHPALAGLEGEPHAEAWPEWCRRLGVHFGADERAFADTYVEPRLYHWDYALKRLVLGLFMSNESGDEQCVYRDADGREYLPFDAAGGETESVAIMVRKARALIRDAQTLAASELALGDWRDVLTRLITTYVNPAGRTDARVRDSIVGAIGSIYVDGIRSEPVPYEVACELARAQITEVEADQGTYAESGVVVGSLSSLRSIPFRAMFMLGLGEAHFPALAHRDPMDLRLAHRRAGDVSLAERDRYMFLEALLAARERIFLSFVARDAQTGEALEPSAVIRDLQFILRGMIGPAALDRLTVAHPVSAHDRRYFAGLTPATGDRDERLETFNRNAFRGARIAALRDDLDRRSYAHSQQAESTGDPIDQLSQLGDDARAQLTPLLRIIEPPPLVASKDDSRVRLSISALRHYLECPLQGAARHALGMSEEDDDEDIDADEEPITRSALDTSIVLRDTLWKSRGNNRHRADLAATYDGVCRMRMLSGSAAVGPFAAMHRSGDLQRLENAIDQLSARGIPDLARWQRIAIGGVDEFTEVQRSIDPIILDVDFNRTDGRRVTSIELRGRVGPVSPLMDRSYKLIGRDAVKVADFLEGALGAIVLAAAGEKMPSKFNAMAIGGVVKKKPNHTRTFRIPTLREARAYLARLATDLLGGRNDYFLPIEAVEAVLGNRFEGGAAIEREIHEVRSSERAFCKSDFGPVRKDKARQFRAPIEEIEAGLIERRYGAMIAIFEDQEFA